MKEYEVDGWIFRGDIASYHTDTFSVTVRLRRYYEYLGCTTEAKVLKIKGDLTEDDAEELVDQLLWSGKYDQYFPEPENSVPEIENVKEEFEEETGGLENMSIDELLEKALLELNEDSEVLQWIKKAHNAISNEQKDILKKLARGFDWDDNKIADFFFIALVQELEKDSNFSFADIL